MEEVYKNLNIFLVEVIGFPNHCSLDCSYCDWEKQPFSPLTELELVRVRRHLQAALIFIQCHYPNAQVIEYSGGEPYVHPKVVELVLEIFKDYWVRINTNGLHIDGTALEALKAHGRVYLALSLDGHTLEANSYRVRSQKQLDRIIEGLKNALEAKIPVALLCTIHDRNIDGFVDFVDWLEQNWLSEIKQGRLMMAAHRMSSYGRPHPFPSPAQKQRMGEAMAGSSSPVILPIREHYEAMWDDDSPCTIYRWAASMHFLGNSLATAGRFTSFRCGMRGVAPIGEFALDQEMEWDSFSRAASLSVQMDFSFYRCRCFVDWRAFDLIFSGVIPMERAKKWFLPIQDQRVQQWVRDYQKSDS